MDPSYKFYNRFKEIKDIKGNFEKAIRNKSHIAYLIRGRKGIGKSRLISEFINEIEKDIALLSEIPSFNKEKNVISFQCELNNITPYHPFIQITKSILKQKKFLNIGFKLLQLILAIFQVNDTLSALENLANSVVEDKNTEKLKQKEIRLFNQYRKFIKKRSAKSPLIIFIQNAQWIDSFSLKLIQKLVSDENQFWGMIILEQDELELSEELNDEFNKIITANIFIKIDLFALDKSFPSKLLSSRFGENFFNSDENDILYTISEGTPGNLIDFIENTCIKNNYLYSENGVWKKKEDFKESIKPVNQKLLELIISLYEDNELSESESRLIRKMALLWGISNSRVNQTVNMVKDVMISGFRVNQILDSGIISNNSFSVTDNNNKRFIIEHVKVNHQNSKNLYESRGFENKHLLEALSYKVCENGVLIIWDYYDGKKSRQVIVDDFKKHISNCLHKFIQISEGLAELHKNSVVHGFLRPRSIIETGEGKYQLATFNHDLYKYIVKESEEINSNDIQFLAPEQLRGDEPTISSDIFSLGVMFYHSLTNKFPFHGRSVEELENSINNDKVELIGHLESLIPSDIIDILRKSLSYNPIERFGTAEEFYNRLTLVKFVPAQEPELSSPVPPKSTHNYTKHLLQFGIVAFVIVMLFLFKDVFRIFNKDKHLICDESVINVESVNKTSEQSKILDPKIIEYLLRFNISNKSSLTLVNTIQFNKIHSSDRNEIYFPQKNIACKITNGEYSYDIEIGITDNINKGSKTVKKITFHDPSELLNGKLDQITSDIGTKNPKQHLITKDWDAFLNFYNGELNLNILNVNVAENFLRKSIAIDSSFLLPKLRLAKIYRFDGRNAEALALLKTVQGSINNLPVPDSIRTVALWNIMNGKPHEAINNYKQLIKYLPGQKEPYYELAEAYFDIRDINYAIANYQRALEIDPNFTLAINHYGYSLSHSGNHDSALVYFKKYVRLDSSANSWDSYGDGFFAAGILDSAKIAKLKGLKLDPNLDYLFSSLAYINIRQGKLKEAEDNVNKYLSTQTDPEKISTGLTNKAFIYLINNETNKSLDTCLKAKRIFDSNDLTTRNHVLHWVLSRIYFETNNSAMLNSEMKEMSNIIKDFKIDQFNYNIIFKFYQDINIRLLIKQGKINEAKNIIFIFDNEIYNKIKDGTSPFDVAYFNTEFGKLFLDKNKYDLAKERLFKALAYNPNYALAHFYLSVCFEKMNLPDDAKKHLNIYKNLITNADPDYLTLLDKTK
jgi:tetratricopeptide (TPR) repeat protein